MTTMPTLGTTMPRNLEVETPGPDVSTDGDDPLGERLFNLNFDIFTSQSWLKVYVKKDF